MISLFKHCDCKNVSNWVSVIKCTPLFTSITLLQPIFFIYLFPNSLPVFGILLLFTIIVMAVVCAVSAQIALIIICGKL